MSYFELADPIAARKRVMGQGLNILRYISEMYNKGELEEPNKAIGLCSLLMLVAEDKIKGSFNEDTCTTEWTLKENYLKKLEEARDAILASKVIEGPWQETLDNHK